MTNGPGNVLACGVCGAHIFPGRTLDGDAVWVIADPDSSGNLMVRFDESSHQEHRVSVMSPRQAEEVRTKPNSQLYRMHDDKSCIPGARKKPTPRLRREARIEKKMKKKPPRERIDAVAASSVDLFLTCSSSILQAESPHSPECAGADLGTAVHEAIRHTVRGEDYRIEHIASVYDADPGEVLALVEYAKQALGEIREPLRHARCEEKIYEGNIRSRQDLVAVEATPQGPSSISSLDWKSGRVMIPKPGQMIANAVALRRRYGMPSSGYIYTAEVWLRDREIIERRYDATRLDAFEERLESELRYAGSSYTPGEGCGFCKHSTTCQARLDYLRASASMLAETEVKHLTPMAIADLWPRKQALERALTEYTKVAKGMLAESGELPLSDGSVLQYLDRKVTTIDARKAWPVMTEHGLSAAEINGVISVQKGKLEEAVATKAKANGRTKKSATAELMDDLRAAGAVAVKPGRYVNLKRKI